MAHMILSNICAIQRGATASGGQLLPAVVRLLSASSTYQWPIQLPPGQESQPVKRQQDQISLQHVHQLWSVQQQSLLQQLVPLQAHHTVTLACRGLRTRAGDSSNSSKQRDRHKPQQQRHEPQDQQQAQQQVHPSRSDLTTLIMSASNPRELLEAVVGNHQLLDHTHIIAALQRATQLWPQTATHAEAVAGADRAGAKHMGRQTAGSSSSSRGPAASEVKFIGRHQLERLMLQLSGPYVRALPDYSAHDVTSALWCYAKCGLQPPPEMLQASINHLCSWDKLQGARPSDVTNLAWAASKLGCKDKQLFSHIALACITSRLQQYLPAQLGSLAWAFAKAGYEDRTLGLIHTAKAVELLQRQLRQQQQQQQHKGKQPGQQQQQQQSTFTPSSLANVIWGSATLGWLAETPELVQLATEVAAREPFVFGFRHMDAASFMWGVASTLGGAHAQHHHQQQHEQLQQSVADAEATFSALPGPVPGAVLDPVPVWQSLLCVGSEAARRVHEARVGSLCRMVWSCAILSGWLHRSLLHAATGDAQAEPQAQDVHAAQAAVAEGRVVLGQLCRALDRYWAQHPDSFSQSVSMTMWGLIAAHKSRLWELDTPPAVGQPTAAQRSPLQQPAAAPTALMQRLLTNLQQHGRAGHQQQQLSVGTVGDLVVALAELKPRLQHCVVLRPLQSGSSEQQQQQQQEGGSQGPADEQVSSAGSPQAVEQQGGAAEQVLQLVDTAVEALVTAAWQHAGTPGALEVRDVSRMLVAFSNLKVDDAGLYRDLLQHWSQEALQGCSSRAFLGAVNAAAVLTSAQPELLQSGSLPGHTWEHLMSAVQQRWGSLSAEECSRARGSVLMLCNSGLQRVVDADVLRVVEELATEPETQQE